MLWKRLYGNDIWAHQIDELEGFSTTLSLIYLEFYQSLFMLIFVYVCHIYIRQIRVMGKYIFHG